MHLRRQKGVGAAGWVVIVSLVLGLLTIGVRLVPHYLDHSTISDLIEAALEDPRIDRMTQRDFERKLLQNMKLNNIREFDLTDRLVFERSSGVIDVDFSYEVREPMFANIDVVMTFSDQFEKVVR